jgi:hypothetical protein
MDEEKAPVYVSAEELAEWFCLSVQRIRQLTADGVLKKTSRNGRKYNLRENVQVYIQNLQQRANGRSPANESELKMKKLEAEIALKESQGELHKLKTEIAMGRYVAVDELELDYAKFFTNFKKFALNLPARIIGLISGQIEPVESRRLEKEIMQEITSQLDAFVIAGKEAEPLEQPKKRGRPKKVSGS